MQVVKSLDIPSRRQKCSPEEWQARLDLAAAYRLAAHYGWTHLINNHISLRVPGTEDQFLINPYGFLYEQITASSLIKIDLDGNDLDGSPFPVNRAGFVIHSAIHQARKDLHAIIHTHTVAGQAVSALHRRHLRGEPLPALGATALENRLAAPRRHARTEPVLALAAADVRLVGALHGGEEPSTRACSAHGSAAKRGV